MKTSFLRLVALVSVILAMTFGAKAADLVQKNAFAYDITVNPANQAKPVVSYKLNGTAKNVKVRAFIDGVQVAEQTGTANQTNAITMDLSNVEQSGKATFSVYVETATTVSSPTLIKDKAAPTGQVKFYSPYGVTVNNCTDSPLFGTIVVGESESFTKDGYHSSASASGRGGAMLYAFDPQMQGYQNGQAGNKYGFNGGINPKGKGKTHHRVKFTDDGRLFMLGMDMGNYGLYEFGSTSIDALNSSTQVFKGTLDTNTGNVSNGSTFVGSTGAGLDVFGSGSNLIIAVGSTISNSAGSTKKQRVDFYNLGTAKTWNQAPSRSFTGAEFDYFIRPVNANVAIDKDGKGFWFGNNSSAPRGTATGDQSSPDYSVIHFNAAGKVDFKDYTGTSSDKHEFIDACAIQYNRDRTILAVSQKKQVKLYKITFDAAGKPSYSKLATISIDGNNINAVAFDYADNIYFVNNSTEYLCAYQLPTSIAGSNRLTPAPSAQAYNFVSPKKIELTTGNAYWSGANPGQQQVKLEWNEKPNATYTIYNNGKKISGTPSVANSKCSIFVPLTNFDEATPDDQVKNEFYVVATVNGVDIKSNTVEVFNKNYVKFGTSEVLTVGTPTLQLSEDPETHAAKVLVSWSPLQQQAKVNYPVKKWYVYRYAAKDGKPEQATLVGEVDGDQTSFVDPDAPMEEQKYYVNARMAYKVKYADNQYNNFASGMANPASVNVPMRKCAPIITELKSYTGRNSVRVRWHMPAGSSVSKSVFSHYRVLRDGIVIVEKGDFTNTVDMNVPSGTHTYQIIAVYQDGTEMKSASVALSEPIDRDQAVTQYGLQEIYNYPILTPEQAAAEGFTKDNALIVDPTSDYITGAGLQNMLMNDGAFGQAGGIYRQGAYKNGKWYVAQLTNNHTEEYSNDTKKWFVNYNTFDDGKGTDYKGGVIEFDAEDILGKTPARVGDLATRVSTNQWITIDESKDGKMNIATRFVDTNISPSNVGTANYMFYLGLAQLRIKEYDGSSYVASHLPKTDSINERHLWNDQSGRVHYAASSGDFKSGGYLYFALNKRPEMFRVKVVNNTISGTPQLFTLPEDMGGTRLSVPEPADESKRYTDKYPRVASTENYAFPVVGRPDDFILQMRSEGYYYYKASDKSWTKILGEAEARNSGGFTFEYNGEIFFLHPSSIHSNNSGHFAIDMPQRASNTASTSTADFTELIPVASFTQKELTTAQAANANGQWFGYEYNEDENCIYIYHYVPGRRFAKYRFYSYQTFPPVEPTIKIAVKHNEDNTDITHFDASISWNRPDKYDHVEFNNFEIKEYKVELLDANMKVLKTQKVADPGIKDGNTQTVKFDMSYDTDTNNEKSVDSQTYTVRVTPFYQSMTIQDPTAPYGKLFIEGETGTAQDNNDYKGSIQKPIAQGFVDKTGNGWYRVDIDFNRADFDEFPEPVSYFTIDYKPEGTDQWIAIPDLCIHYQGNVHAQEDDFTPIHINGQYLFGMPCEQKVATFADNAELPTDKALSLPDQNEPDAFKCVAYHATQTNPTGNVYRVTAHYAAGNKYIAKSFSEETKPVVGSFIPTGVSDIVADGGHDTVTAYPVPTYGQLTVSSPDAISTIGIYSLSGACVKTVDGNNDTVLDLDISELAAGVYMLRVNGLTPIRVVKK